MRSRHADTIDPALQTALDQLTAAGPPHDAVAQFLERLARGEHPPLPDDLPEPIKQFLTNVAGAARANDAR